MWKIEVVTVPFESSQSSSVDLRRLQPLERPHPAATATCVPRSRIIKLRNPTKLGVSAPWVRLDMRCCEWVAKTWRYLVSRIFAELLATGSGMFPLDLDRAGWLEGGMAVAVDVAVSVRVDMASMARVGCGCPEADIICGRGRLEVGTESGRCQWQAGGEGRNDASSSLARSAGRKRRPSVSPMAPQEAGFGNLYACVSTKLLGWAARCGDGLHDARHQPACMGAAGDSFTAVAPVAGGCGWWLVVGQRWSVAKPAGLSSLTLNVRDSATKPSASPRSSTPSRMITTPRLPCSISARYMSRC